MTHHTEKQHTKTPWEVDIVKDDEGIPDEYNIYAGNIEIAYVSTNQQANASFIVTACNCHDELVSLLTDVESMLFQLEDCDFLNEDDIEVYKRVKQALLKTQKG